MSGKNRKIRYVGRGTPENLPNRFDTLHYEPDPDLSDEDQALPRTQFLLDASRTILAFNDSPDIPFDVSLNPYRGCEHGCVYCYARPSHEYLGFSSGLDFESKILVKLDAPSLLRKALSSPKWVPRVIGISGITDPYQPAERQFRITRQCLEVLAEYRNPVRLITKNHLVTRDLDHLSLLASYQAVSVVISIISLDPDLVALLEPRTTRPARRLDTIRQLADAGIPVGVMIAPVIPGLTDHEIPAIVEEAVKAGATSACSTPVRLPYGVGDLFVHWLERYFPDRKDKVLNRIRAIRGGQLDDPRFGVRMTGEGIFADQIQKIFQMACRRVNLSVQYPELSAAHFRVPGPVQQNLF